MVTHYTTCAFLLVFHSNPHAVSCSCVQTETELGIN